MPGRSRSRASVRAARGPRDYLEARRLIERYIRRLPIDLEFQGITGDLRSFPAGYLPPSGGLFLARCSGAVVGCVAVRRLSRSVAEVKRLYVRPSARRRGIGRSLTVRAVAAARTLGYRRIRLDTLASMRRAIALYRSMGFREIPPYRYNPAPAARYFELALAAGRTRRRTATRPSGRAGAGRAGARPRRGRRRRAESIL